MNADHNEENTLLVYTTDTSRRRDSYPEPLKVEVLAGNLNLFMNQMEGMLQDLPEKAGPFEFTEFKVSVEITGGGKFVLLGSGVEASATGGMTFTFTRKKSSNK